MKNDHFDEGPGCCPCDEKTIEPSSGFTCADKENIFTKREQEVLDKIREASLRAGVLKEEISRLDERGREAALLELERLRLTRAELEKERLAASEERMRLLGHL
ncbi:MAG TPA: hypothetical protein HPP81_08200 [Deltaproteobacteria bacterium]|jgi:hypothetical protein|nr:hypothetical protein [Deltaproteobacteria bacterium]HIJ76681.1 hypothetical protein [Deltaproteobacteria bacterium]